MARCSWHGVKLDQPDWGPGFRNVAFTAELQGEKMLIHIILNAYWEPLEFKLPTLEKGGRWHRWIDNAFESPPDIVPWETSPLFSVYQAESWSVVVLFAEQ